ncbi:DUF2336 domain-containing protein [Polymorphum gilvum]|uniref:Hypothetical conserved protein n=1 Tax=Polymorphum gilvum (strain LMG 25793 / CGMCC 1.9160 / SL003B-26A1) TaxID=991905 RepID=F2J537_POLGS|nr:DUF2336 domain-containing protein [Polymorphum gilvum]ADZ70079.1 Hypothetical conserved protein [Polymorphum gilvum SL003B-26A1]
MIIRDFLRWIETAPAQLRAEATSALARAWLFSQMTGEDREAAEAALTFLLDDPASEVRLAIAHAFARQPNVPEHIIASLAQDRCEIACVVLEHSPLIGEADLVDLAAEGDEAVQCAIARRIDLGAAAAAALAEVAPARACEALLANETAEIVPFSLTRMAERFAEDGKIRALLLSREHLPLTVRHMLLKALADGLRSRAMTLFEGPEHRAEAFLVDAEEKVTLSLVRDVAERQVLDLVEHLRATGQLTTRLLLRAAGTGNLKLFVAAIAVLSGLPAGRARTLLEAGRPAAIRALLRKAGLPPRSLAAFGACIDLYRVEDPDFDRNRTAAEVRAAMEQAVRRLRGEAGEEAADIVGLLRQFALEAAREEARVFVSRALAAA